MKKKIVLPPLFVLSSFLVGLTPKTSKVGAAETYSKNKIDSFVHKLNFDSCYYLQPNPNQDLTNNFKHSGYFTTPQNNYKDSVSYKISWYGGKWVKYTSQDGSGFIRAGGSRTWRNMNPGAIRHGDFSKQYGACGSAGGFAVFPTEKQGMNALYGLLQSDKYTNLTIASAIYKYSPPADNNNTKLYQRKLSKMTGLNLNRKLCQLTPTELDRVANAIKEIEGWKSGKEEIFEAERIPLALKHTNFLKQIDFKQKQYQG